jgi:hypothetical protein
MPLRPSTPRPRRRGRLIEELRRAIDCLPSRTREAMLEGIARNERIIVGAYVDDRGGVCPMLAAHRCGGRTDLLSFARAWDRFTGAGRESRRASERELGVLVAHLQASLLEEAAPELDRAISEHRKLRARHRRARAADPTGEIRVRRLRRRSQPRYNASPGRTNIISGITHAGESRSR